MKTNEMQRSLALDWHRHTTHVVDLRIEESVDIDY